ncbi:hypothetical protein RRG08_000753 [Elysia crispata]|uniref:Uncharacterized protein n=1 Tax=Elysia crispata TaxID=231223 RepID=A0AAE1D0F3_9GAST|nr:hypothetical protein RRG08_000753 [Elysia crispata]
MTLANGRALAGQMIIRYACHPASAARMAACVGGVVVEVTTELGGTLDPDVTGWSAGQGGMVQSGSASHQTSYVESEEGGRRGRENKRGREKFNLSVINEFPMSVNIEPPGLQAQWVTMGPHLPPLFLLHTSHAGKQENATYLDLTSLTLRTFSTRPQNWRRQTIQVRSSDETSGGGARSYLTSLTSLTLRTFSTRPHTAWRRQRVKVRSSDETSGGGARSYLTSLTSLTLRTRVWSYSLGQCLIHNSGYNEGDADGLMADVFVKIKMIAEVVVMASNTALTEAELVLAMTPPLSPVQHEHGAWLVTKHCTTVIINTL